MQNDEETITADLLLEAYRQGIFPMAQSAESEELSWYNPTERGIIPLHSFHVPRRLARTVRQGNFELCVDRDFRGVVDACAASTRQRPTTWINRTIVDLYTELYHSGHAHSIEVWRDNQRIGGLYGVRIGRAFFGESMYSRARDASKIALVGLVGWLRLGQFSLLDTQFLTEHLEQFGAVSMAREQYRAMLVTAIRDTSFPMPQFVVGPVVAAALQPITQTS